MKNLRIISRSLLALAVATSFGVLSLSAMQADLYELFQENMKTENLVVMEKMGEVIARAIQEVAGKKVEYWAVGSTFNSFSQKLKQKVYDRVWELSGMKSRLLPRHKAVKSTEAMMFKAFTSELIAAYKLAVEKFDELVKLVSGDGLYQFDLTDLDYIGRSLALFIRQNSMVLEQIRKRAQKNNPPLFTDCFKDYDDYYSKMDPKLKALIVVCSQDHKSENDEQK